MNVEDLPYTTLLASGAMKDGVKRLCNENIFAVLIMSILVCVLYSSLSKGDVYHTSSRPNKVQLSDGAIVKPCHLFILANSYLFIRLSAQEMPHRFERFFAGNIFVERTQEHTRD